MLLKSPTVPSVAFTLLNILPICLFADWHRKMTKYLCRSAGDLTWHSVCSGEGRSRKAVKYILIPAVAILINSANLRSFTRCRGKKRTQWNNQSQTQHLNEFSFIICWSNFCISVLTVLNPPALGLLAASTTSLIQSSLDPQFFLAPLELQCLQLILWPLLVWGEASVLMGLSSDLHTDNGFSLFLIF